MGFKKSKKPATEVKKQEPVIAEGVLIVSKDTTGDETELNHESQQIKE